MTSVHSETGSIHAVVVICLVVALLCALGVIFYQQFVVSQVPASNSGSTQAHTSSSESKESVALVEGTIDSSFGTTFSYTYPETWKLSQTMTGTIEESGSWQQITKITSPSGKYTVRYDISAGGGIGGYCVPEEAGTIGATSYEAAPHFAGMSYVELIYKDESSFFEVGLLDRDTATRLKVGDSVCEVAFKGIKTLSSENAVTMLRADMSVSGVHNATELKAALSGAEYERAKAILLSTTH